MPVYEYRCPDCRRRASVVQSYSEYGKIQPACPECGGSRLQRIISRTRFARSEESRLESLADPSAWGDVDENDPRSMAKVMRRMGSELGEEMEPEFHEAVDRLEAGENPEDIEKSMPGMGGSPDSGGLDDLED
ncbi:MAG: zinc ribbon domain-containing protein [Candidatus Aminicenantes bacterium]|nr:zinc ribbon domain-containing protein [Candidatus Aminicenantes bacterium]